MVVLDDLKQVHDIQVPIEHFFALFKLKVLLGAFHTFQLAWSAAHQAAPEVATCIEGPINEAPLVQNQVEDVVQLLSLGLVANKLLSLLLQVFLELTIIGLLATLDSLQYSALADSEGVIQILSNDLVRLE